MASRIDHTKTLLGKVKYITVDGTTYPTTSDGVMISHFVEWKINYTVYSASPTRRAVKQYFRIDCQLAENTLANLKLAWNQPDSLVVGATFDTLRLNVVDTLPTHTLIITGEPFLASQPSGRGKERRYYFDQVFVYESKPQQKIPNSLVFIPISFYAMPNDAVSFKFGRVEEDK